MDDLGDSLDQSKWKTMDVAQKKDFQEYHVNRQHKKVDDTSIRYLVQPEGDADPKGVVLQFTLPNKDPLKNICVVELRLKDDKVIGIDLNGDCFQLVGN